MLGSGHRRIGLEAEGTGGGTRGRGGSKILHPSPRFSINWTGLLTSLDSMLGITFHLRTRQLQ